MAFSPHFRIGFFCIMTSLLVLGGCRPGSQWENSRFAKAVSSIEPATGTHDIRPPEQRGEEDLSALSPLEQHLRARKMVDPNDMSSSHAYTFRYDPETGHLVKAFATVEGISEESMKRVLSKRKPMLKSKSELRLVSLQEPKQEQRSSRQDKVVEPVREARVSVAQEDTQGQVIAKSSSGHHAVVTSVRRGEHKDKTRLVLDLTESASFEYQMDEEKNVLAITLPGVVWQAEERHVYGGHPLLLAYLAKPLPNHEGTLLAIKMKKNAQLVFKSLYEPNDQRGYRLVFDVAAR